MAIHVAINHPTPCICNRFVSLPLRFFRLQPTGNVSTPQLFYLRQFWKRNNSVFKLS